MAEPKAKKPAAKKKPATKKPAAKKPPPRAKKPPKEAPVEAAEVVVDEIVDAEVIAESPVEAMAEAVADAVAEAARLDEEDDEDEDDDDEAEPPVAMTDEEKSLSEMYASDLAKPASAHAEFRDHKSADEDRPMTPEINARDERKHRWEDRRDQRRRRRDERDQRRADNRPTVPQPNQHGSAAQRPPQQQLPLHQQSLPLPRPMQQPITMPDRVDHDALAPRRHAARRRRRDRVRAAHATASRCRSASSPR